MKATYDPQVQALYVTLLDGEVARTEQQGEVLVDLVEDGSVRGYEFLLSESLEVLSASRIPCDEDGVPLDPRMRLGE